MERRPFEGARELVAHAQGLAVLPYFALANGFLGGQVRRRSEVRRDARGERLARHLSRRGHRVLSALDEIAFAHGVQPATIALAWLLAKPTVAAPVVSATQPDQVEALIAAASVRAAPLGARRARPRVGLTRRRAARSPPCPLGAPVT